MDIPGSGAAGGLGGGMMAFLSAKLKKGVDTVSESIGLEEKLHDATLAITGEGRCDGQTANGKTPFGVAQAARKAGVPAAIIAGSIGPGADILFRHGIKYMYSLVDESVTCEEAMRDGPRLVAVRAAQLMRAATEIFSQVEDNNGNP
jgi:glycerate kinase